MPCKQEHPKIAVLIAGSALMAPMRGPTRVLSASPVHQTLPPRAGARISPTASAMLATRGRTGPAVTPATRGPTRSPKPGHLNCQPSTLIVETETLNPKPQPLKQGFDWGRSLHKLFGGAIQHSRCCNLERDLLLLSHGQQLSRSECSRDQLFLQFWLHGAGRGTV